MPEIAPFEEYADQYEAWFDKNQWVYDAELRAIKDMIPSGRKGLEIGVGTGRFAAPLGILHGVEPSKRMKDIAQMRGIQVKNGVAEALPFDDSMFDVVLMVTTVCFVDDIHKALAESFRVLSDKGFLVIGFIDRNSKMGKIYLEQKKQNVFYKNATFLSVNELVAHMDHAGFRDMCFNQTIFGNLRETGRNEPIKPGYGKGSFVVIRAQKNKYFSPHGPS